LLIKSKFDSIFVGIDGFLAVDAHFFWESDFLARTFQYSFRIGQLITFLHCSKPK